VEGFIAYGEPRHARDRVAARVVRPVQRDDSPEGRYARWARDPRHGELRGGVRGGGGFEPCGCDQDEGDEHEGGARGGATLRRRVGLCSEDCSSGGAHGSLQGFRAYDLEAGTLHCRPVRDAGTGSQAA